MYGKVLWLKPWGKLETPTKGQGQLAVMIIFTFCRKLALILNES